MPFPRRQVAVDASHRAQDAHCRRDCLRLDRACGLEKTPPDRNLQTGPMSQGIIHVTHPFHPRPFNKYCLPMAASRATAAEFTSGQMSPWVLDEGHEGVNPASSVGSLVSGHRHAASRAIRVRRSVRRRMRRIKTLYATDEDTVTSTDGDVSGRTPFFPNVMINVTGGKDFLTGACTTRQRHPRKRRFPLRSRTMPAEEHVLCFRLSKATLHHEPHGRRLATTHSRASTASFLVSLPPSLATVPTCVVYRGSDVCVGGNGCKDTHVCVSSIPSSIPVTANVHSIAEEKRSVEQRSARAALFLLRISSGRGASFEDPALLIAVLFDLGRCLRPLLSGPCDFHFIHSLGSGCWMTRDTLLQPSTLPVSDTLCGRQYSVR